MKGVRALVLTLSILTCGMLQAQESQTIKGKITDGKLPMKDVAIRVEPTGATAFTDEEGGYEITASPGDLIHYTYTGMKPYRVRVEDVTRFLNLIMIPDVMELDEVTVTKSNRKSQADLIKEYPLNKKLIQTAFGVIDAETAPGYIRFINEDEIRPIGLCVLDLLRSRFANMQVFGNCQEGGFVTIRGGVGSITNRLSAIWDVDGMIFRDAPIWIDVNNIKRLAVFTGLAMTTRYGTAGGQGVIVVNTISASPNRDPNFDLARLRNNYVTGKVLEAEEVAQNAPTYLRELQQATSLEDAQKVYYRYETTFSAAPHFFLDAFAHFSDRSGGQDMAAEILASHMGKFEESAPLLKALAYTYEAQNRSAEALQLYKEIFVLRPHYSQSYLDLARAYRQAGETGKAAAMFARYKYLLDEGFLTPSEEFGKIIQHESDNLLALEGRSIGADTRRIKTDPYVQNSTRVVVEWNDSEAEFDLQFVNPEGQYTTWKHTYADNEDLILDEKDNGYSVAEFVIDENLPGTWTLNAIYHGNKSLTPSYLKVTSYTHYGERSQQAAVRTVRLQLKGVNQKLLTLNNPGVSVIR